MSVVFYVWVCKIEGREKGLERLYNSRNVSQYEGGSFLGCMRGREGKEIRHHPLTDHEEKTTIYDIIYL